MKFFFHSNTFADDNQPLQVMISPEDTKETNALFEERSGRDGEASASGNGDFNQNQTEENVFPCSIETSGKGEPKGLDEFEKYSFKDPDQDMEIEENGKCSFAFTLHVTHTEQ